MLPEPDFAADDAPALPLHALRAEDLQEWLNGLPEPARAWVEAAGFSARPGEAVLVPDASGGLAMAAAGLGDAASRRRSRFALAGARARLPARAFRLESRLQGADLAEQVLGWLLAGYRFDRYRAASTPPGATIRASAGASRAR